MLAPRHAFLPLAEPPNPSLMCAEASVKAESHRRGRNRIRMNTCPKRSSGQDGRPESGSADEGSLLAALLRNVAVVAAHKCFVLRTYQNYTCNQRTMNTSGTKDLKLPGMNTYQKQWVGVSVCPSGHSRCLRPCSFALFCTGQNTNLPAFMPLHTLSQKHRGVEGRLTFKLRFNDSLCLLTPLSVFGKA